MLPRKLNTGEQKKKKDLRQFRFCLLVSVTPDGVKAALDDLLGTVDARLRPPFEGHAIEKGILEQVRGFDYD